MVVKSLVSGIGDSRAGRPQGGWWRAGPQAVGPGGGDLTGGQPPAQTTVGGRLVVDGGRFHGVALPSPHRASGPWLPDTATVPHYDPFTGVVKPIHGLWC